MIFVDVAILYQAQSQATLLAALVLVLLVAAVCVASLRALAAQGHRRDTDFYVVLRRRSTLMRS